MTACYDCKREWSGFEQAHCPRCHEHFTGVEAFDRHREGPMTDRSCIPVERFAELGKNGQPLLVEVPVSGGTAWARKARASTAEDLAQA